MKSLNNISLDNPFKTIGVYNSESSDNFFFLNKKMVSGYSFCNVHDSFGTILDISGNGIDLKLSPGTGALTKPVWGENYGIKGGGYKFYSNSSQSQYLYRDEISSLLSMESGTISIWIKFLGRGNPKQCIFSISNGFVSKKTEFVLIADYLSGSITCNILKDGIESCEMSSEKMILSSLLNVWTNLTLVYDSGVLKMYINGERIETKTKGIQSEWFSSLLTSNSKPTRFSIGATPRHYSPFMALGLFAFLDEIRIWDAIFSETEIKSLYEIGISNLIQDDDENQEEY